MKDKLQIMAWNLKRVLIVESQVKFAQLLLREEIITY